MDNTRLADLEALKQRMEDVTLPLGKRRQAARNFESIKKQMTDSRLTELRRRLVQATIAKDNDAVEHIGYQIKAYTSRKHY